jgi:hypothetical protein
MAHGRRIGIVGNHHDRLPQILIELPQHRQHVVRTFRIEIAGGLVGEDDFRFVDDGARDGYALLLAAG